MNISDYPRWTDIVYGASSGIILFASIFMHSLTIVVISRSRRLQSTTNYFLINLSVLGICSSMSMLFTIVTTVWKYLEIHHPLCKIVPTFVEIIICNNQLVLVSISIDRYYTLTQPQSFKITKFQVRKMIFLSIAISIVISCPFIYLLDTKIKNSEYICAINVTKIENNKGIWTYLIAEIFLSFVIPFIIIIALYFKICTFTWTFGRHGIGGKFLQRTSNNIQRPKVKILKILILITIVDLFSMVAINILKIFQFLYSVNNWNNINVIINILFYNMIIDPIIYLSLNSHFRNGFKEVLCWSKRHYYRTQAYSVTTITAIAKRNYISNYNADDIGDFKQKPRSNLFEFPNVTEKPHELEIEFDEAYGINYFDNIIYSDKDFKILKKPDFIDRTTLIKY